MLAANLSRPRWNTSELHVDGPRSHEAGHRVPRLPFRHFRALYGLLELPTSLLLSIPAE